MSALGYQSFVVDYRMRPYTQQEVSYLFAGEKRLNCTLLLEKLRRLFGINKLMLVDGGIVNGLFLAENLVAS